MAVFRGTVANLRELLRNFAGDSLVRLCKNSNRGDLLPTAQDLEQFVAEGMTAAEVQVKADAAYNTLLHDLTSNCMTDLGKTAASAKLGRIRIWAV